MINRVCVSGLISGCISRTVSSKGLMLTKFGMSFRSGNSVCKIDVLCFGKVGSEVSENDRVEVEGALKNDNYHGNYTLILASAVYNEHVSITAVPKQDAEIKAPREPVSIPLAKSPEEFFGRE